MSAVDLHVAGGIARIDAEDLPRVAGHAWRIWMSGGRPRVRAHITGADGVTRPVLLHRFVLGMTAADSDQVRHKNRDGLDCTRQNLIRTTSAEICADARTRDRRGNQFGLRGVVKVGSRYHARVRFRGRNFYSRVCDTPEQAARAYPAMFAAIRALARARSASEADPASSSTLTEAPR